MSIETGDWIIEACNLSYMYPDGTQALRGVSLKIPKGGKIALLGSNGAGKSTLFLHLNGILRPREGVVRFAGSDLKYDRQTLLELRKNVGIVFQDPDSQLFSASVYQEISFGPLNLGLPEEIVRERVETAMAATGTGEFRQRPTHMLSYGQKKRVCIAGILAMNPSVMVCDEPTAWLDPKNARQIISLFNQIASDGTTVIISTHDVNLAYSWADYVFIMAEGNIMGEGDPESVFRDEILMYKTNLEKPWLVEIHEILLKKGCFPADSSMPRNRDELYQLLRNNNMCRREEMLNDFNNIRDEGRERNNVTLGIKRL
ncbi:MAG: energy-coupling factor ABC transporter ATP-binding protein [Firmicutes bacterium HGW-Firmicutes-14]|nr:MAG: energy-coupling factor ABC transporter ATP-binding protein [Firmicutes bacterium HGW-Firmicutes-14]